MLTTGAGPDGKINQVWVTLAWVVAFHLAICLPGEVKQPCEGIVKQRKEGAHILNRHPVLSGKKITNSGLKLTGTKKQESVN